MFKIETKDIQRVNQGLGTFRTRIPDVLRRVLRERLQEASSEARPKIPVRGGALKRRFGFSIKGKGENITGRIGFIRKAKDAHDAIAANVLESGAMIVPKKANFLWIPIGVNRDALGRAQQSPREIQPVVILRSKAGNLIAFKKDGEELEPMFALTRQVVLKARPVIAPMKQSLERADLAGDIEEELQKLSETTVR